MDGLLFINLHEDEWSDMGIENRFHIRKLQLILKSYRIRYQRRKDKIEINEEDDLLSEISPSELSEMIAGEELGEDEYSSEEESSVSYCLICMYWYKVVVYMICIYWFIFYVYTIISILVIIMYVRTVSTYFSPLQLPIYYTLLYTIQHYQNESYQSEDELELGMTEEQRLQKQLDAKNIRVDLTVRGDGVNFPVSI